MPAAVASSALPYVALPVLEVGGVAIQTFAPIVLVGVLVGADLMQRYAARQGLTPAQFRALLRWVLLGGFLGAHWVEILAYHPDRLRAEGPLLLLRLWDGLSSVGGFLGGALAQLLFVRRHRLRHGVVFDSTGVGLVPAFTIGRIGCTLAHDHVGRATDFALGVDYPRAELVARGLGATLPPDTLIVRAHHLGMYELAYLLPLCALVYYLAFHRARALAPGQLAVLTTLLYMPVRLWLDGLRMAPTDPRYAGLTVGQWGAITAIVAVTIVGARTLHRAARSAPPSA